MPQPSVLILRTAGTNCDEETQFAFERAGAKVVPIHVRELCESTDTLNQHSILALPGGFSYGDDLGSGVVLGNEITQRLREPFHRFVERGGLVIGICNGFQVLVKTGLLPGRSPHDGSQDAGASASDTPVSLTFNDSRKFEDRWVKLLVGESPSPFLSGYAGKVVTFPVAHGEGKFVVRDDDVLSRMTANGQIAFRYTADGLSDENAIADYPHNPNGSICNIAGITDPSGHVLGLMPHPERHVLTWQHPHWTREGLKGEGDGNFLFRNAVQFAQQA